MLCKLFINFDPYLRFVTWEMGAFCLKLCIHTLSGDSMSKPIISLMGTKMLKSLSSDDMHIK